jgi:hypothetical protein
MILETYRILPRYFFLILIFSIYSNSIFAF